MHPTKNKKPGNSIGAQWRAVPYHHRALGLLGMIVLSAAITYFGYPSTKADTSLFESESTLTCSSEIDGLGCQNARPETPGDWVSKHEKNGAWIQYAYPSPARIHGVVLVDRAGLYNDITDGHLEFDGGKRYPESGGIGPLNDLLEPILFPNPITTSTVKFVVDDVSGGTVDAGLAVFRVLVQEAVATVQCSSVHTTGGDTGHDCRNALWGVAGEWWGKNDDLPMVGMPEEQHPWIQLTVAQLQQPITITGVLVNAVHNDTDNIILDGHLELINGDTRARFPVVGGLGPMAQYYGKPILIDPAVRVTVVRFVADRVPGTASRIGLEELSIVNATPEKELLQCSGMRIDPQTNDANCGACGQPCGGEAFCSAGECKTDKVTVVPINFTSDKEFYIGNPTDVMGEVGNFSEKGEYTLQVVSADGNTISQTHFAIPTSDYYVDGQWQSVKGDTRFLVRVPQIVTQNPDGSNIEKFPTLVIRDLQGNSVASGTIVAPPMVGQE